MLRIIAAVAGALLALAVILLGGSACSVVPSSSPTGSPSTVTLPTSSGSESVRSDIATPQASFLRVETVGFERIFEGSGGYRVVMLVGTRGGQVEPVRIEGAAVGQLRGAIEQYVESLYQKANTLVAAVKSEEDKAVPNPLTLEKLRTDVSETMRAANLWVSVLKGEQNAGKPLPSYGSLEEMVTHYFPEQAIRDKMRR